MYSPFDFERIPTVDAANLISGDRILFGPVKRARAAVKLPADSEPVKVALGDELELISYGTGVLVMVSQLLQSMLSWCFVGPNSAD